MRALPRLELRFGVGGSLRVRTSESFEQERTAPPYVELQGAAVWGTPTPWQHGLGISAATGLAGDGGLVQGVEQLEQWVLRASYVGRLDLGPDWVAGGHAGPAFVTWGADHTWGVEAALSMAYRWLGGSGGYAQAGASWFAGGEGTGHTLLSVEAGLFLRAEVLP